MRDDEDISPIREVMGPPGSRFLWPSGPEGQVELHTVLTHALIGNMRDDGFEEIYLIFTITDVWLTPDQPEGSQVHMWRVLDDREPHMVYYKGVGEEPLGTILAKGLIPKDKIINPEDN